MIFGNEYRSEIIKEHIGIKKQIASVEFIAKELVDKVIDENPYMPLYIEFLIAKKRKPELNEIFVELQEQAKESLKKIFGDTPNWLTNCDTFQFITDFVNAMILGSDVLEARENFKKNRKILEKMFICILENGEGYNKVL
nr:hypothetical protein [Streptococcus pseudoporcinus]